MIGTDNLIDGFLTSMLSGIFAPVSVPVPEAPLPDRLIDSYKREIAELERQRDGLLNELRILCDENRLLRHIADSLQDFCEREFLTRSAETISLTSLKGASKTWQS